MCILPAIIVHIWRYYLQNKLKKKQNIFIPSDYLITLPATRCPRKSNLPRQTTKGCRPCVDVFYEIVAGRYLKIMRRAASAQSILLRCLPRWYQYRPVARTAGDLPSNNEGPASWSRRIRGEKKEKKKSNFRHISPPYPRTPWEPAHQSSGGEAGRRRRWWCWMRQSQKPAWPCEGEGEKCRRASEHRGEILDVEQPLVLTEHCRRLVQPGIRCPRVGGSGSGLGVWRRGLLRA